MNNGPRRRCALMTTIGCLAGAMSIVAHAGSPAPCALVTAAEYTAIVGGKPDGAPVAGGSTCSVSFDRWQRNAQVQVVEGWGMGDSYQDLVKFWREENAKSRKGGAKVTETTVKDAFCEAAERPFQAPSTRCMRELPGERVIYATISATSGSPPPAV